LNKEPLSANYVGLYMNHFYTNAFTNDSISSSTNGHGNGLGMPGIPDATSYAGIRIVGGLCAGLAVGGV